MQRCLSIVVIIVLGVVLGVASGEHGKHWRTSLSSILMSLGLKKRRPMSSICEKERDKANTLSKRQSKELQQRAYLDPLLYASSLNRRRDVNHFSILLGLGNKRRIVSVLK